MPSAALPLALAGPWRVEMFNLVTGGRQAHAVVVTLYMSYIDSDTILLWVFKK